MQKNYTPGIHSITPRNDMVPGAVKLRRSYALEKNAPFYQREFGFYSLERWKEQGMPPSTPLDVLFKYDPPGEFRIHQLGWTEAAFVPAFPETVLEDRNEHEVVQDPAGRRVLYFKGRRSGFMPEYLDHPVKDQETWERLCAWRLDPNTPERLTAVDAQTEEAIEHAREGRMITLDVIGGYMYLRSLMGPEGVLYMFYDQPDLIRECMSRWFTLADTIAARIQKKVSFDQVFLAEDICYNHGPLISPDMIREFLMPYYQQLLENCRSRQLDKARHLYVQIDTDGFCEPVIPLYKGIGMDVMSPFEVAAGCDVIRTGRDHPELVISGGVDKRILARGPAAIDAMIDEIFPVMQRRGGYIPTCDHGVPEEVSYQNYLHYRKRALEFA